MGNEMVIVFNKHRRFQGRRQTNLLSGDRAEVDIVVVVVGCGCRNFEKLKLGRGRRGGIVAASALLVLCKSLRRTDDGGDFEG